MAVATNNPPGAASRTGGLGGSMITCASTTFSVQACVICKIAFANRMGKRWQKTDMII